VGLIQIDTASAGQQVICPLCQGMLVVPPEGFLAQILAAARETSPAAPPLESEVFTLACPTCTGPFQVLTSMSGQQLGCPHCGSPVTIPPLAPAEPPAYRHSPDFSGDRMAYSAESAPPVQTIAPPREDRFRPGGPAPSPQSEDRLPPAAARRRIDDLLPPGVAAVPSEPEPAAPPAPANERPPGAAAGESTAPAAQQVALPQTPKQPAPLQGKLPAGSIVVPTPDGSFVTVRETPRTIGFGDEEIEIRRLTSDEKANRRLRNNLILGGLCVLIILVVFIALVW